MENVISINKFTHKQLKFKIKEISKFVIERMDEMDKRKDNDETALYATLADIRIIIDYIHEPLKTK